MIGQRVAEAALALVGTRFRLNGRDAASGIDCIGLVELSLKAAGCRTALPNGYTLRTRSDVPVYEFAEACGLVAARDQPGAGDIVVVRPGLCQLHVLIFAGPGGFVHAHAGLRRVTVLPLPQPWPEVARFRPVSAFEDTPWRP